MLRKRWAVRIITDGPMAACAFPNLALPHYDEVGWFRCRRRAERKVRLLNEQGCHLDVARSTKR